MRDTQAALTPEEFSKILDKDFAASLSGAHKIAIGVSGGPDSMALALLLSAWGNKNGVEIHALTVDHGLRAGSATEAKGVAQTLKDWPGVKHVVLRWKGRKPKTRIMEAARAARYELMAGYCADHGIGHLFLAHHQDDQAETFLFRLAKGSGLDGLSGMKKMQRYDASLMFLRPLLDIPKERLIATCRRQKVKFIKDPSNEAARFARPRLRKARRILEEEGLSSKQLATTAARLERARKSLEGIAKDEFKKSLISANSKQIVLKSKPFLQGYEEIALRLLIAAIHQLRPEADYLPRMEKIEAIFHDMIKDDPFRKRTLGGLVFERDDRRNTVRVSLEK